ncbi:hypothetical protein SmJEL517_g03068 [Synchytrium microbalum]|uniref:ornithine decarboxylase n=1 Tax=Synchytrium microbalum TaxID=1806994 RepID=A0A507C446_9FUNG|nr:uncharacterized protein SmJEL517_g03068 [Synchytrium microbalum]TPX34241.1 hypothetical protein SmJEL517_g03068 [Synchytrium microbalum]
MKETQYSIPINAEFGNQNNSSNYKHEFQRKYSLKSGIDRPSLHTLSTSPRGSFYEIKQLPSALSSAATCASPFPIQNDSIGSLMRKTVASAALSRNDELEDSENSFFIADLGCIQRQYFQWKTMLPRVEPFYAVKCNPDPTIVKTLASVGANFDCASKAEIQTVLDMGVDPSRIIYANPCKQLSYIKWAATRNVNMVTFDNADELVKIKAAHPHCKVVLRILADDSHSVCKFGVKFGASQEVVPLLLQTARDLDLDLVGVSFHVGSGCGSATAFSDAVALARSVFDVAENYGFNLSILDIGGGFPGRVTDGVTFPEIATVLRPALDTYFPAEMGVRIIAEPGRYFVSSAYTLAVNIVARRVVQHQVIAPASDSFAVPNTDGMLVDENVNPNVTVDEHPTFMYYVNDGMYGSFNCLTFDHAVVTPRVLSKNGVYLYDATPKEEVYGCSIWGPTCDSIDCISKSSFLPQLDIGDWLYFENMGAYTCTAASTL